MRIQLQAIKNHSNRINGNEMHIIMEFNAFIREPCESHNFRIHMHASGLLWLVCHMCDRIESLHRIFNKKKNNLIVM